MKQQGKLLPLVGVAFCAYWVVSCATGAQAPPSQAADSAITNNQEAGVDEGGIVKAWGDYLIVLRRGRLFTVRLGDQDLQPVCMVDAFPPGQSQGSWYDEMLVHESTVAVVGYSYGVGATEVGLFDLDEGGCVRHRTTFFLRSNDYFSVRNYASRLIGGQLVFYMPHGLSNVAVEQGAVTSASPLPAFRQATSQGWANDWQDVMVPAHMHLPIQVNDQSTLHTVVTCDLGSDSVACNARGMLGGFGRVFYVSSDAVFVWVSDGNAGEHAPPAVVYRLPFDATMPPGAVRAYGMPTDQFSFRQSTTHLNVLVRTQGRGDWMAGPDWSSGAVALLRLPLRSFDFANVATVESHYTPLPTPEYHYQFQNRFVDGHVLYGTRGASQVYVHPLDNATSTTVLELSHNVERIEALGTDALVVGTHRRSLHFSSVALERYPYVMDRHIQPNAIQGEERSHGFFFKQEGDRQGMLGLPIRFSGWRLSSLRNVSAAVLYLDVSGLRFSQIGSLMARRDDINDRCQVSCVDWYGNSRPIFYRNRIFALMGYELVEGIVRNQRIVEVGRTHLYRDVPEPRG